MSIEYTLIASSASVIASLLYESLVAYLKRQKQISTVEEENLQRIVIGKQKHRQNDKVKIKDRKRSAKVRPKRDIPFQISDYTVIGNFVFKNDGFKAEIDRLIRTIEEYGNRNNTKRPLNIALVAQPGSGISYLVSVQSRG